MTPGHDRKGNRWLDTVAPRHSFILYVYTYINIYIYAWRIPWTKEPSGLQSMASQRVGHD